MKDFLKKNKTYLAISIYLILVGLVGFFVARPMVLAIEEKSNQIQQKIAIQERKEEKLKELPLIRSQYEEVRNQEEKMDTPLKNENIVSLVERLEKISEETGNKITMELSENKQDAKKDAAATNSEDEKDALVKDLPSDKYIKMKIVLSGRYGNFLNFINKVENMEYYSDIVSVAIRRESESGPGLEKNPFSGTRNLSNPENKTGDKDNINSQTVVVFYLENK
jgi:F0F1-type ATP synthase membrane subunit b/b'